MSESEKAKIWQSLARQTVKKVNFGWWLDRLTPLLIVLSLVVASTILVMRSLGKALTENPWFYVGTGIAFVGAAVAAWMMARRHFIQTSDGLVRLEDRMELKNALTTADRGVGQWPEAPGDEAKVDSGLDWNWLRVATPFAIAAVVVAASLLIPITSVTAAKAPPSEPLAWAQMEEWMETLEEEEVIEEDTIEEVREKIEELRGQPDEEWFSHSSLEATDTLRNSISQQLQNLGADLATAERDLNALQNYSEQLSQETKEQLMQEYDEALKNMATNGMPLNSEMMEALKGIDPQKLAQGQMSQMSQEQLDQLREAMKKASGL